MSILLKRWEGYKMKKLLVVVAAVIVLAAAMGVLLYLHLNPSFTLKGQVIDADNHQVVPNATVTVNSKVAKTDSNGEFTLALGHNSDGALTVNASDYDSSTTRLSSASEKSSGVFSATLTQTFKATPTVQTEATRKWNYIKYGQYDKVWTLIDNDEKGSVSEKSYTSSLSKSMTQISDAGAEIGGQTIASVVTLPSWTEPNTGKTYKNVRELQTTQSYTILGQ